MLQEVSTGIMDDNYAKEVSTGIMDDNHATRRQYWYRG